MTTTPQPTPEMNKILAAQMQALRTRPQRKPGATTPRGSHRRRGQRVVRVIR